MKKYLLLLTLLAGGICNAQYVTIPNPVFKALLLSANEDNNMAFTEEDGWDDVIIDTNGNNEIEFTEALAIKKLNLDNANLSGGILGLEAFTNLKVLSLNYCNLEALDINMMTGLKQLDCSNNMLTTLDVSGMNQLVSFEAGDNYLTAVNLTGLNNLELLNLDDNMLTSINLALVPNLETLVMSRNQLTAIDVSFVPQLDILSVMDNMLTSLDVSMLSHLYDLDCSQNELNALNINGLTSLSGLFCSFNQLTTLNVAPLIHLESLHCSDNLLTSLDVAPLTQLFALICGNNQITTINVAPLVNLEYLYVNNNLLTQINIASLSHLMQLNCANNLITALNFNAQPIMTLWCTNNQYTTLDISSLAALNDFACGGPQFTSIVSNNSNHVSYFTIDDSPLLSDLDLQNFDSLFTLYLHENALQTLDLSGTAANIVNLLETIPNLTYINFKNGATSNYLSFSNPSPNLAYVCADEEDIADFTNMLPDNVQVNSYCSFTPGGTNNTISGTVLFDGNQNGCDANDVMTQFMKVTINDGTNQGAAFLNDQSQYSFFTGAGTFTLTPHFENPSYFNVTPADTAVTFAEANGSNAMRNFCITPNGIQPDAEIVIVPIGPARPGFDSDYQLVYSNKGNQTISGTIAVDFDDAHTDFVSAYPIANQSGNVLSWTFTNLAPFKTRVIQFSINLNGPMETPALNDGDILHFSADMTYMIPDVAAYVTEAELNQIIVNSLDPNDKTCLEGNTISPDMIGNYVHYNINFENIGTAPAQNVVVKDVIDNTKFDIASLQVIYASHPVATRINGNKVEFIFENINLPGTSGDNKGNVLFKIKTKPTLVLGNSISNKAEIFFDYNFPIETNEATSTFAVLKNQDFTVDATIGIYPNPSKGKINVKANSNIRSLQLFDMQGRILQTLTENSKAVSIDISGKQNGIYFLNVTTEKGSKTEKLVKE